MGYMRHHAIVVTSYNAADIKAARDKAEELLRTTETTNTLVSPLVSATRNGYQSFLIAPDGSKEWWDESDRAAEARAKFLEWVKGTSLSLDWVLVQFGDDEGETKIDAARQSAKVVDDSDAAANAEDESAFAP